MGDTEGGSLLWEHQGTTVHDMRGTLRGPSSNRDCEGFAVGWGTLRGPCPGWGGDTLRETP